MSDLRNEDLRDVLPTPFTPYEGKGWLSHTLPPPGNWEPWDAAGIKGWTLKCLPVFKAEIRFESHNQRYWLSINDVRFGWNDALEPLQKLAEQEIVSRVRAMLPAYRRIHERVMALPKVTPNDRA